MTANNECDCIDWKTVMFAWSPSIRLSSILTNLTRSFTVLISPPYVFVYWHESMYIFVQWIIARGRVVRIVDSESLTPRRCGFESRQGLWILSCVKAIQLPYETSVVLFRCPLVLEIMHGGAPEVFLHHLCWNVVIYPLQLYSVGAT